MCFKVYGLKLEHFIHISKYISGDHFLQDLQRFNVAEVRNVQPVIQNKGLKQLLPFRFTDLQARKRIVTCIHQLREKHALPPVQVMPVRWQMIRKTAFLQVHDSGLPRIFALRIKAQAAA